MRTTRSPSSRRRRKNLPRTRKAGVPYEIPSSTPGNGSTSLRTVSQVTGLRFEAGLVLRTGAIFHQPIGVATIGGAMGDREHDRSEPLPLLYTDLADWFYLVTAPEDYEEEAAVYRDALRDAARIPLATLLELGSGGGNNASH